MVRVSRSGVQARGPATVNPSRKEVLPPTGPDEFLAIARIAKPQGRHGEVVAEILTDFPERFENLNQVFLENPGSSVRTVAVEKTWPHKGRIVLKFSGVDSIDAANHLRGLYLFIRRDERMTLPKHQYFVWELEGCRVVRELAGVEHEVGIVTEVERTGAADVMHVECAQGRLPELLIPLAQDICKRIDLATKTILIDPPDDLLELNG